MSLPQLIKLTDWQTGAPTYIAPSAVHSIRLLPAEVCAPLDEDDAAQELGSRTRIDTSHDILLVRETPEQIMSFMQKGAPDAS